MKITTIISASTGIVITSFLAWSYLPSSPPQETAPPAPPVVEIKQMPVIAAGDESTALKAAANCLQDCDLVAYRELRRGWEGAEQQPEKWFMLDIQELYLSGKSYELEQFLASRSFRGRPEADRLIRLAALQILTNPNQAQHYLTEAALHDPGNTDIHLYKAALYEANADYAKAEDEYILAIQKDLPNAYLRELLGEYYLRVGKHADALQILTDALPAPSLDSVGLKLLFWNRMVFGGEQWHIAEIPEGQLAALTEFINDLPRGDYWENTSFAQLPDHQFYQDKRQEVFWLKLVEALRQGSEKEALILLQNNAFANVSWAPQLEKALKVTLTYRLLPSSKASDFSNRFPIDSAQDYLASLDALAEYTPEVLARMVPTQLHAMLLSKEALALPFIAVQWREAALWLHGQPVLGADYPKWVAFELTQDFYQNRGASAALDFALAQEKQPDLALLIAELALELERPQVAMNALLPLYKNTDATGPMAAYLLAGIFYAQDNYKSAKDALNAQASLAQVISVRELLARIAVREGDMSAAHDIYHEIEAESTEAQSFLLSKAMAEKNWKYAKKLNEALLEKFPDNVMLGESLLKIASAQK